MELTLGWVLSSVLGVVGAAASPVDITDGWASIDSWAALAGIGGVLKLLAFDRLAQINCWTEIPSGA